MLPTQLDCDTVDTCGGGFQGIIESMFYGPLKIL